MLPTADLVQHFTPGTNARAWLLASWLTPVELLSADLDAPPVAYAMTGTGGTMRAAPSAEQEVLGQFAHSEYREVLAKLPQCFQATIYLADVEGYSCQDVADILGVSIGTVMSRLHRARLRIRKHLNGSSRTLLLPNQWPERQNSTDSVA